MATVKKALKKAAKKAVKKQSKSPKSSGGARKGAKKAEKKAGKKPAFAKAKPNVPGDIDDDDDDLPPEDEVEEAETLDTESLAAEVERTEEKDDEAADDAANVLPSVADGESADANDADQVLPSMEWMSILRETELNDVIQDVKRRSEANGGYITYEELNQILPSNIVDAIQSDKYLKILEALGVQVIREDDVKKYLDAKNAKQSDPKQRTSEMIEDPIRMYLHQMGQIGRASCRERVLPTV